MSHVEMCQGEATPTSNVSIPPPPAVPATSICINSVNTPLPVERDDTTECLNKLKKVVRDTLIGGSQTVGHPDMDLT